MRSVKIIFIKKTYSHVYIGKNRIHCKKKLLMHVHVFIKKIKLRVEPYIFNLKNPNSQAHIRALHVCKFQPD